MLLVDQNKAIIVGKLDTIVKELAFLVDKLSEQGKEQGDTSSEEKVMDLFHKEVAGFKKDRENGIIRDHPHDEGESSDAKGKGNRKERATAAEAALIEAMKEIQEMRADKEKALKKKKEKKKNKKEK